MISPTTMSTAVEVKPLLTIVLIITKKTVTDMRPPELFVMVVRRQLQQLLQQKLHCQQVFILTKCQLFSIQDPYIQSVSQIWISLTLVKFGNSGLALVSSQISLQTQPL